MRAIAAALGVVVALGALVGTQPVEAAWGDGEHMSASVTSTSLAAPAKAGCSVAILGLSTTYNWTNPTTGAPRTGYVFEIYQDGALRGSTTLAASATSASTSDLLGTLLGGVTYEVRLRAVSNGWNSPVLTGSFAVSLLGLITGCTW